MRADRLISILLLLQSRERMTARELARELEVSERTIYRDIDALSASGVPLYAESGPGGGIALLGHYRTNLTGLNEDELRALYMAFGPASPLEPLGAGQSLRAAMRKLSASLSTGQRGEEGKVRQRFLLDGAGWSGDRGPASHLSLLQRAVWDDRCAMLRYQSFRLEPVDVITAPYGLVSKAGNWYLVGMGGGLPRVYRVHTLLHVEVLAEHFTRQPDFDLATFWAGWCAEVEQSQQSFQARVRVTPLLRSMLPSSIPVTAVDEAASAADPDGWIHLTLAFETFEAARQRILGFGSAAEVLEPEALRRSLVDFAGQVLARYR